MRIASRRLTRHKASAGFIIASLGLSVGLFAETFALAYTTLFKPLPFPEPDRLVVLAGTNTARSNTWGPVSYGDFTDWHAQLHAVRDLSLIRRRTVTLTSGDRSFTVAAAAVSAGLFQTLGITALEGRMLSAEADHLTGGEAAVLLSEATWKELFGGDRHVIRRSVSIDGIPTLVTGIVPNIEFPPAGVPEIWLPLSVGLRPERESGDLSNRGYRFLTVVARLSRGVTLASAQAELNAVTTHLAEEHPSTNRGAGAEIVRVQNGSIAALRAPLLALSVAVGFLLLMACVNVVVMQIATALRRRREFATEVALGAGRAGLLRAAMLEAILLGTVAGLVACLGSYWLRTALIRKLPVTLPRMTELPDANVVAVWIVASSILLAVLLGCGAWLVARPRELAEWLKGSGANAGAGRGADLLRRGLVVLELAVAIALLIGAGIALQAYLKVSRVPLGLARLEVLSVRVEPPSRFSPPRAARAFEVILRQLADLPGVTSVGATQSLPLKHASWDTRFKVVGRSEMLRTEPAGYVRVAADYFGTMRIPLLQGRYLDGRDLATASRAIVINDAFAKRYFEPGPAVGTRLAIWDGEPVYEIVGVVANTVPEAITNEPAPTLYVPYGQHPRGALTFVVDSSRSDRELLAAIRQIVLGVDLEFRFGESIRLSAVIDRALAPRRYLALVLGIVACLAAALSVTGVYAVIAHIVATEMRDFGVRIALGAPPEAVSWMIVSRSGRLALIGSALGIAIAWMATRGLGSVVTGIPAMSLPVVAGVSAAMLLVSVAAGYGPARRAGRIDPVLVLRRE